ncbi:DUF3558 domain-containing protein [Streptomyces sp. NRRL F-5650]|uniref:DUF3558 domain-containing protein n=1 Tax=Streptomyces sp. NRRL F-5650 TaxID=1463868 RepID=UPI0004CC5C31|nr:DUF3558 domain-containing protein [Streptomyces sp. NRRL F-5650]
MPRSISHPPRRLHRHTLLAISVTGALALTACTADTDGPAADASTPTPSASAAPRGLLTKKEAAAALDNYEKVNNKANTVQDARLLGTVEAGQVYEESKGDYTQWDTMSKKDQKFYETPFYYRDREFLIPAASSGATWFAVKARPSSDSKRSSALVILDKVGGSYKVVNTVYSEEGLPKIAVDKHGYVLPADPAQKIGALAPNQISEAYEDFFETGGKTAGKVFASTDSSKESTKVHTDGVDKDLRGYATEKFFAKKPTNPKVYALKLDNGGVLAVFPTAHTSELMLKPQYMGSFDITPGPKEAAYDDRKRDIVTDKFEGEGLAVLHPTAKPRVTGIEYGLVDSR